MLICPLHFARRRGRDTAGAIGRCHCEGDEKDSVFQLDERQGAFLPRKRFIDLLSFGTLPKGTQIIELRAQTMRRELESRGPKSSPPQAGNAA
jgi:hypothetical protein